LIDSLADTLDPLDVPELLETTEDASGGLGTHPDTEEVAVKDGILVAAEVAAVASPVVELAAEIPVPEMGPLLEIDALPETPLLDVASMALPVVAPDAPLPETEPLAVTEALPEAPLSEAEPLALPVTLPDAAVVDIEPLSVIETLPETPLPDAEPLALPVILPDAALPETEPLSVTEALPETPLVESELLPVIDALPEAITLLVIDALLDAILPETILLLVPAALPEESLPVTDALADNEPLMEAELPSVIEALLDVDPVSEGSEPELLPEVLAPVVLADPEFPSLDSVDDVERLLPPVPDVVAAESLLEASVAVPLETSELPLLMDIEASAVEDASEDAAKGEDELGGGIGYGASVGTAGA